MSLLLNVRFSLPSVSMLLNLFHCQSTPCTYFPYISQTDLRLHMVHIFIGWMHDLPLSCHLVEQSIPSYISSFYMFMCSLYWLLLPLCQTTLLPHKMSTCSIVHLYVCTYLKYVSVLKLNLSTFFLGSTFMFTLSLILVGEYLYIIQSSNFLDESYMSSLVCASNVKNAD